MNKSMNSTLSESQQIEIDANNRKAKAIISTLVRAIEMSDTEELDIYEMVMAAYDYIDRNDRILGGRETV